MDQSPRWNRLADYFIFRFGERAQKIPLDAAASCPNRDGTISHSGCIFCNAKGSGTGYGLAGLSLAAQWSLWRDHFQKKGIRLFIAYLQSFSNTYGSAEKLRSLLDQIRPLPGLAGLCIGTRPDCLEDDKLKEISAFPIEEKWLEIGAQTYNNKSLKLLRRGHDSFCVEDAVCRAHAAGLKVCLHLMAGLPGESGEDFLQSVKWAAALPIDGLKLHSLYVCAGTYLADMYERGEYMPLSQAEYVSLIARALPRIRQGIVIHRITGDPFHGEMLAPMWAIRSRDTANKIRRELLKNNTWQGKDLYRLNP